jgi:hypothetical protein
MVEGLVAMPHKTQARYQARVSAIGVISNDYRI